jgi:hypothetical protein
MITNTHCSLCVLQLSQCSQDDLRRRRWVSTGWRSSTAGPAATQHPPSSGPRRLVILTLSCPLEAEYDPDYLQQFILYLKILLRWRI